MYPLEAAAQTPSLGDFLPEGDERIYGSRSGKPTGSQLLMVSTPQRHHWQALNKGWSQHLKHELHMWPGMTPQPLHYNEYITVMHTLNTEMLLESYNHLNMAGRPADKLDICCSDTDLIRGTPHLSPPYATKPHDNDHRL